MPGKVNPVIPETVNQIAFQVVGQDVTYAHKQPVAYGLWASFDRLRVMSTQCISARY